MAGLVAWVALRHAAEDLAAVRELAGAGLLNADEADAYRKEIRETQLAAANGASARGRDIPSVALWNAIRSVARDLRVLHELEAEGWITVVESRSRRDELALILRAAVARRV